MGEIAEDMINGRQCSNCGVMFVRPHGFPVICKTCSQAMDAYERPDMAVATIAEI